MDDTARQVTPSARTPLQQLGGHIAAARGIVDLAAALAGQIEYGETPIVDPASMRRALREALRHLEDAEAIVHELPEVANG